MITVQRNVVSSQVLRRDRERSVATLSIERRFAWRQAIEVRADVETGDGSPPQHQPVRNATTPEAPPRGADCCHTEFSSKRASLAAWSEGIGKHKMITQRWFLMLLVFAPLGMLLAGTVPLTPYAATNFTVSMPRSWTVTEDAANGMVLARQDANREDSAAVLFLVRTADANVSEDQLLDSVASQFAKGLNVRMREPIRGGGHRMIADGMAGNTPVRVGVIALTTNGAAVVSLLISKPGDFENLGGIELVTGVLMSLKPKDASAPPAASPQGGAGAGQGGRLDVPPLARPLTVADLAGEWSNDDSVVTNYVNYRGDYAGFQSISTREKWVFDGRGGVSSAFTGTTAGRGGARQVNEKKSGTVSVSQSMVITLAWSGAAQPSYVIRGWRELTGMTVLLLNGPWWGNVPADVLADRRVGTNLNSYWVRKSKP